MKTNSDIIDWAANWLINNSFRLQNKPEILLETPWSNVVKFSTTTDDFYLKQTAPDIYIEAAIIKLLEQKFAIKVANIVAVNNELHCFLMLNAGITLRKYLKNNFQPELLCQALGQFANMQRSIENNLLDLFALSVPDWRLKHLPQLYTEIIKQRELLLSDGMTESELQTLQELRVRLIEQCSILAEYKIPETLVQPDCNTNNILINPNTKRMTVIDLGEIVVAHPFLALENFLYQATIHEEVIKGDSDYVQMQNAYLQNWLNIANDQQLQEISALIKDIYPIYNLLFHYRLKNCVDINDYQIYYATKPNQLAKNLREYISNVK